MYIWFRYNWQVRDQWFEWCRKLTKEELTAERNGGVGSILQTLFHIVDVEQSWIQEFRGEPELEEDFAAITTLEQVEHFSKKCRPHIEGFIQAWTPEMETRTLRGIRASTGNPFAFQYGEVMRHVIAHEIHHIGQLSVWARELGLQPVSANLIDRGLFSSSQTK